MVTRVSSPERSGDPDGPGLSLSDLLLSPLVPSDADLAAPRESLSLLLRQPRLFLPPEVGMTPQISFTPPTNTPQAVRSTYLTP